MKSRMKCLSKPQSRRFVWWSDSFLVRSRAGLGGGGVPFWKVSQRSAVVVFPNYCRVFDF